MRAIERDRLLARAAWAYFVVLAAVAAYYLWPPTLPNVVAEDLDLSRLPVKKQLDFDEVRKVRIHAVGATGDIARRTADTVAQLGGDAETLEIQVDGRDALLDALAALRAISNDERHVTFVLRFEPDRSVVRLNRGSFDDPNGRIGRALLERRRANTDTATASSTTAAGSEP